MTFSTHSNFTTSNYYKILSYSPYWVICYPWFRQIISNTKMEKKINLQLPISLYIKLSNNRFWRVPYISLHYGKAWKVEEIFKNIKI